MKPATLHRSPSARNRSNLSNEQSQRQPGALQPETTGLAGGALAKPISALGAQDVLALQRSVGNRATNGYMQSGRSPQPQTAISRTGPRIQRSLGKSQESSHAVHTPSGKRFEVLSYDLVTQGETKLRRYYLKESEETDTISVLEDNDDYDWITVTPQESEESEGDDNSLSEIDDLSNFNIEEKNNNNEESSAKEGILPIAMRPGVKLYMDQGCAGHLGQVQLFSGQFSTCSPVIMFNKETKIGGLYHYGAGPMNEEKSATLMKMIEFIKPTVIHALQGTMGGTDFAEEELENLPSYMPIPDWFYIKKFLQERNFNNLTIDKDNKWLAVTITLGEEDSSLSISGEYPDIDYDLKNVKHANLPEKFPHFGKKEIDKTMWF